MPVKRTALGRFRHEAATTVIDRDGHAVVFTGDDGRFEYLYKFVSAGRYGSQQSHRKHWPSRCWDALCRQIPRRWHRRVDVVGLWPRSPDRCQWLSVAGRRAHRRTPGCEIS